MKVVVRVDVIQSFDFREQIDSDACVDEQDQNEQSHHVGYVRDDVQKRSENDPHGLEPLQHFHYPKNPECSQYRKPSPHRALDADQVKDKPDVGDKNQEAVKLVPIAVEVS